MPDFADHVSKRIIREAWCKPIIKFINEHLGYKFIYMGLPSPDATDIMEWVDYLDYIIAFQCRNYPEPSSPDQSRENVQKLEEKLNKLEQQKKIRSFSLYDGYIEEVILSGRDTIGSAFSQKEFITLYNLDFCNNINTPVEVIDVVTGNLQYFYKSQVIEKLLKIQNEIQTTKSKKFIMFLTVHNGFYRGEENFFKKIKIAEIKTYQSKVSKISGAQKTLLLLRAYTFALLKKYFIDYGFIPEFLPVINYRHGKQWLLVFTVIGTYNEKASTKYTDQRKDFLDQEFLTISNNKISTIKLPNLNGKKANISSVNAFTESVMYKDFWCKKQT